MKILHFAHSFFPVYGGTSVRIFKLLNNDGNDHYLFTPNDRDNSMPNLEDFFNIHVTRLNLQKIRFLGFIYHFVNINKLLNKSKKDNYDIVHAHNPFFYMLVAYKFAKKHKKQLICEIHRFEGFEVKFSWNLLVFFMKLFQNLYKWILTKKIFQFSTKILVQTHDLKEKLINDFKLRENKIVVIQAGVDLDMFNPLLWQKNGLELKKKMITEKNQIILSYNGHFSIANGVELLITALEDLSKQLQNKIQFVFIGRGPLLNRIKALTKKYDFVYLLENIEYNQMPLYNAFCDIIVIPWINMIRTSYNLPTKLLQAISMKKIILTSDVKQIKDLVGNNCLLFNSDDINDLKNKILFILNNFDDVQIYQEKVQNINLREYNWNYLRTRIARLYCELI